MISVKIYNPAGATEGLPHFGFDGRDAIEVSETFYLREARVREGRYAGEQAAQIYEGAFEIFTQPERAEVSAARVALREGTVETVQIYAMWFDEPIRYAPAGDMDLLAPRVERAIDAEGVAFEGNRFANDFSGGHGDDSLFGLGGADVLRGGRGDDFLSGGPGEDRLIGGRGDDEYLWGDFTGKEKADVVVERAGEGVDTIRSYIDGRLPRNVENMTLLEDIRRTDATGNGLDNVLRGSLGANVLDGRAGDDRILGGEGADRLIGGAGRDLLSGQGGADRFVFERVSDSPAGADRDVIRDFRGADLIDLRAIDADRAEGGRQDFVFIGADPFSGAAGELRYARDVVSADTDGDGRADFQIDIANGAPLTEASFLL